jgi:adenosylcobinamide-phosphate synthase
LLPEFLPSMVPLATSLWILFAAVVLDRMVGDPDWLWRRLRHPVVLFGGAIAWTDRHMNRETDTPSRRRAMGCVAIIALVSVAIAGGLLIVASLRLWGIFGLVLEAVCVAILLAQKSLSDHVGAVSQGLRQGGLAGGRQAVSMIVGRDPETLDAPAVSRAAIESLAENFSDGVVAPVLWYLVFGLPGLFAYKMINTADSMIGHRNERYEDFGKAAARLDDVANWPAARLSAVLLCAGALLRIGSDAMMRAALVCRRDGSGHGRSPRPVARRSAQLWRHRGGRHAHQRHRSANGGSRRHRAGSRRLSFRLRPAYLCSSAGGTRLGTLHCFFCALSVCLMFQRS